MNRTILFVFLPVLAALRAAWVFVHPVAAQEAYYRLCASHMAPAFFDGPAGTAAVLNALAMAGGVPDLLLARLLWPLFALGAGVFVWLLAKEVFDDQGAAWAVVAVNALPQFNMAAVTLGPLMPAVFFTLAGTWAVRRAWAGRGSFWFWAGVAFGLGLFFRYEVVLVAAGLIVATLVVPRRRTKGNAAGLAWVALACACALWPSLRWNAALEWVPVAGGTLRSAWEFEWSKLPGALVGGGVGRVGAPVLLAGGLALLLDARRHSRARFLAAAMVVPWVWWVYGAARGEAMPAAAFLATVPAIVFLASGAVRAQWGRLAGIIFLLAAIGSMGADVFAAGRERSQWEPVAAQLRAALRDMPAADAPGFLIAEDPDLASVTGYHLGSREKEQYPPVFVPESPDFSSQFAIWPSYADFVESTVVADEYFTEQKGVNPFMGRNALYLGADLPQTIEAAFENVAPLSRIVLPGGRKLTIFLCLNYQTLPL